MKKNVSPADGLSTLIADGLQHLQKLRYQPETLKLYKRTWNAFYQFSCDNSDVQKLSNKLVEEFLRNQNIPIGETNMPLSSLQQAPSIVLLK